MPRFILVISIMLLFSSQVDAYTAPDSIDSTLSRDKAVQTDISLGTSIHEISLWGGYSFDSMHLWGKTRNTTMQAFGLRYNMKILRLKNAIVEYIFKLNLFSKYSYPEFKQGSPRNSITGYGFVPLGFQINFRAENSVQPFLNTTGGFVFLDDPFPDIRGRKFNFTLGIGGGIEFLLSKNISLSLGMRYHHLSNGELGKVNPGIDSSVFYSAITIF